MKENEKIKKVRKTLKLSQKDISDALGVSKQYFSRVENGQTSFSKEKAVEFCNKYNVSADWLLRNKGSMFSGQDKSDVSDKAKPDKNQKKSQEADFSEFSQCIGLFSSYIKAVFTEIEENSPNADIDDKLVVAASLFFKDIVFKNIPLSQADAEILKFEQKVKDSEDFKDRIMKEYYENYAATV